MMILIVLLILFVWGFYSGYRRGLLLQLFYLGGCTFSYFVAVAHYRKLMIILEMFIPFPSANSEAKMKFFTEQQTLDLNKFFYAGLAFVLIYVVCYFVFRIVAIFAYGLRFVPFMRGRFKVLSGISGFLSIFLLTFMMLKLLTTFPINSLQSSLYDNFLVKAMMGRIPFFSNNLQELWVFKITGK
ncbi:MAG: CvpA family protein [Lactobacillales bacterium]|jgi:uncharacterized membrane protein required for colicin V production|nr:CvpA family protein [Lactobacillales bacterium]